MIALLRDHGHDCSALDGGKGRNKRTYRSPWLDKWGSFVLVGKLSSSGYLCLEQCYCSSARIVFVKTIWALTHKSRFKYHLAS